MSTEKQDYTQWAILLKKKFIGATLQGEINGVFLARIGLYSLLIEKERYLRLQTAIHKYYQGDLFAWKTQDDHDGLLYNFHVTFPNDRFSLTLNFSRLKNNHIVEIVYNEFQHQVTPQLIESIRLCLTFAFEDKNVRLHLLTSSPRFMFNGTNVEYFFNTLILNK